MDFKNKVINFFLTTRPYSYTGEIARGIVFGLALSPQKPLSTIMICTLLSLLMWLYFNWQSDYIQNDPGRIKPSLILCYSPLFLTLLTCIVTGQFFGVVGVLVYVITILLYAIKTKASIIGTLSPLIRILTVIAHFVMIATYFNQFPDKNLIIVVLYIAIYKGIRNLVGDIRDIRTDKMEIPARFGIAISINIIRIGYIILLGLTCFINMKEISIISFIFALLGWTFLEVFFLRYKEEEIFLIGYLGHRLLVLLNSIYIIILTIMFGLPSIGYISLLILLLISHLSYRFIPGKNYPTLSSIFKLK